jgi:hypothetical protein
VVVIPRECPYAWTTRRIKRRADNGMTRHAIPRDQTTSGLSLHVALLTDWRALVLPPDSTKPLWTLKASAIGTGQEYSTLSHTLPVLFSRRTRSTSIPAWRYPRGSRCHQAFSQHRGSNNVGGACASKKQTTCTTISLLQGWPTYQQHKISLRSS